MCQIWKLRTNLIQVPCNRNSSIFGRSRSVIVNVHILIGIPVLLYALISLWIDTLAFHCYAMDTRTTSSSIRRSSSNSNSFLLLLINLQEIQSHNALYHLNKSNKIIINQILFSMLMCIMCENNRVFFIIRKLIISKWLTSNGMYKYNHILACVVLYGLTVSLFYLYNIMFMLMLLYKSFITIIIGIKSYLLKYIHIFSPKRHLFPLFLLSKLNSTLEQGHHNFFI